MFDRGFLLGGKDEAGPLGHARERGADAVEKCCHVLLGVAKGVVDGLAVGAGQIADLQDAVDEHPQPKLGGDAARANVWAVEQAEVFEVLHFIADGGGADFFCKRAGEGAGANRSARFEVAFDHAPKHFARTFVHVGELRRRLCHFDQSFGAQSFRASSLKRSDTRRQSGLDFIDGQRS